jgi:hypothetical protein
MTNINWSAVHNASERLMRECNKLKRHNGSGCTHEELIEALNNVRARLESEKRK